MQYLITMILLLLTVVIATFSVANFFVLRKMLQLFISNSEDLESAISDNDLNNDYIQSALNILDSKKLNCDIVSDDDGHRWIAVSTSDGKNVLNLLRLDDENFGPNVDWKKTEKKLINLINNEVKDFLEKFEEKNATNKKD